MTAPQTTRVTQADRDAAIHALSPKLLTFKDWQANKRDALKARIARIKAHMGDELPEVQSAMMARQAAEAEAGAREAALREALGADLAAYDAVVRDCPASKTFLGEKLCPKCKAGPDEGCREEIRACFFFLSNARALLANPASEGPSNA